MALTIFADSSNIRYSAEYSGLFTSWWETLDIAEGLVQLGAETYIEAALAIADCWRNKSFLTISTGENS